MIVYPITKTEISNVLYEHSSVIVLRIVVSQDQTCKSHYRIHQPSAVPLPNQLKNITNCLDRYVDNVNM